MNFFILCEFYKCKSWNFSKFILGRCEFFEEILILDILLHSANKIAKNFCAAANSLISGVRTLFVNQILDREVLRVNFTIFAIEVSNKYECKLIKFREFFFKTFFRETFQTQEESNAFPLNINSSGDIGRKVCVPNIIIN